MLSIAQPSRIAMVRILAKYSDLSIEIIATLDDSQIHDLATRLKHRVVVSDDVAVVPQEISLT